MSIVQVEQEKEMQYPVKFMYISVFMYYNVPRHKKGCIVDLAKTEDCI